MNSQAINKTINTRFILQISATDNGKPAMSDTATLTITVYTSNNFLPGVAI
jgi:hypothetical protein